MSKQLSDFLKPDRLQRSSIPGRNLSEEVLSDSGRIIPSPPFRRLQSKAQVFSLEVNAGVRTRLTHSMEVALHGRILARQVFDELLEQSMIGEEFRNPFITTVENACLLHDIGNPPFGHFGEFTIQEWFSDKKRRKQLKNIPNAYLADLQQFDGNSQGFRIISRLSWAKDGYGMNLTCSLLLCYLKYGSKGFMKKPGYFTTENERVREARRILNLGEQRFPLTFLMEACDDIAYCLSDIEDGIEKGLVDFSSVAEYLTNRVVDPTDANTIISILEEAKSYNSSSYGLLLAQKTMFLQFKIALVRALINKAKAAFLEDLRPILEGSHSEPLLSSDAGTILGELKNYAMDYIFSSKEAYDLELLSNAVIKGLLESFLPLFKMGTESFQKALNRRTERGELELEKRLCLMLPGRHVQNYRWQVQQNQQLEPALRAHLFLDYISGMTDTHALEVFQILSGVRARVRA